MKLTAAYKKVGDWWAAWVEEIPGVNTQGNFGRSARKLEGRTPHASGSQSRTIGKGTGSDSTRGHGGCLRRADLESTYDLSRACMLGRRARGAFTNAWNRGGHRCLETTATCLHSVLKCVPEAAADTIGIVSAPTELAVIGYVSSQMAIPLHG